MSEDGAAALLGSRPALRALVGGFLFGLLGAVAYPPIGLYAAAFIAPVPLMLVALRPCGSPRRAGLWAGLGVAPWWGIAHVWTISVSQLGFVPLVLLLSVYAWLFVWIVGRMAARWGVPRAAVFVPIVWVGLEFLRGSVAFDGYAFYLTAHPLVQSPGAGLAAPAAWLGTYFVSFLVAVIAAMVAGAIAMRRRTLVGGLAGVLAMGVFALALPRGPMDETDAVRFAVVQTNVPQDNRSSWTLRQRVLDWLEMRSWIEAAAEGDPDVIVLPEGMFPGRVLQADGLAAERAAELIWPMEPEFVGDAPELAGIADYLPATELADDLIALQGALGVPVIVGASGYDGFGVVEEDGGLRYVYDAIYNSVLLVDGGRAPEARYDKLHLAPFGEVMPYISKWPWLERQLLALGANGMTFSLAAGDDPTLLPLNVSGGEVGLAAPICFEGTVPHVCRRLVFEGGERRAQVMVNLTNDGWFGRWTPGRLHHALACRWRCVELETPMVRAANTGISGAYDARGRVIAEGVPGSDQPDRVAGVMTAAVPVGGGSTMYARVGDAFGWSVLVLTVGGIGATCVGGRGGEPTKERDDR